MEWSLRIFWTPLDVGKQLRFNHTSVEGAPMAKSAKLPEEAAHR